MFEPLFYFQATFLGAIAVQSPTITLFSAIILSLAVGDIPLMFWASLGGCQLAMLASKRGKITFTPELSALFMGCTFFSYSENMWDIHVATRLALFPFIALIATGYSMLYFVVLPIVAVSLVSTFYFVALEHQLPFMLLCGFVPAMLDFFWAPKKEKEENKEEKKE